MNQMEDKKQIVTNKWIDSNKLDQEHYFQSLFQEACNNKLLSDPQIENLQLQIVSLMGKVVDRYTSGESSSVRVEKAQELLQSITYCIGTYLKTVHNMDEVLELLKNEKIEVLFNRGMNTVSEIKEKAYELLLMVQKNMQKVNNYAYEETIVEGLPGFFHDYNIEFGGHDTPGTGCIDYPLLDTITDLLGVEYIYEYLRRLMLENELLCRFPVERINSLLKGFDHESEHMLINLFELVLNNVIGCELLESDIQRLEITAMECKVLQSKLKDLNREELILKFGKAFDAAGNKLCLSQDIMNYSKNAILSLATRVYQNLKTDTLDQIFISFHCTKQEEEPFIDGEPMEDEKLRKLIDELRSIPVTSQKVNRIREEVHSLYDLTELLEECINEEEYGQLLDLLNETEKSVLRKRLMEEAGEVSLKDYVPENEWQKILFMNS